MMLPEVQRKDIEIRMVALISLRSFYNGNGPWNFKPDLIRIFRRFSEWIHRGVPESGGSDLRHAGT